MKLSVLSVDTVKWPVHIPIAKDGGTVEKVKMTAEFKRLDVDQFREKTAQLGSLAAVTGDEDPALEFLHEVLVGWNGVFEEDGKTAVPFDEESRDILLKSLAARVALMGAYNEMIEGRKAKNS